MPTYAIYDITSNAVRWMSVQPAAPAPGDGFGVLELADGAAPGSGKWDVIDGALVRYVPTIADHRADKVAAATAYFNGLFALPNGFTFSGKLYQMDDESRANWVILGAGADRSAADPTAFPWTDIPVVAADNSVALMDVAAARAFSQATIGYWAACRPVFRTIKDAIAAAADQAALDAIDVTTGYPAARA